MLFSLLHDGRGCGFAVLGVTPAHFFVVRDLGRLRELTYGKWLSDNALNTIVASVSRQLCNQLLPN